MKRILCAALLFLFVLTGCAPQVYVPSLTDSSLPTDPPSPTASPLPSPEPSPSPEPAPVPVIKNEDFRFTDYNGVVEALDEIYTLNHSDRTYDGSSFNTRFSTNDIPAPNAAPDSDLISDDLVQEQPDWLGTNVQVDGVDEGDIVKTDGEYIYLFRNSDFLEIYRAKGTGTVRVSRTALNICKSVYDKAETDDGWLNSGSEIYIEDMYLSGDSIIFVATENTYEERWSNERGYVYNSEFRTCVFIYDVSVPEAPVLTADIAQDGSYCSGRIYNGVLYLTSRYDVVSGWVFDRPETYIPHVYNYGTPRMLPADSIVKMPDSSDAGYLVVSAIDTATGDQLSTQAILGGGRATMYMNSECICLASPRWENEVVSTYTESVYSVKEYVSGYKTCLVLLELLDGGTISAASCGEVDGNIIGQFAIDEHGGYLRIVTTSNSSTHKVYTDEQYGFTNYVYPDGGGYRQSTGLYVLDHELNTVGSVTGLSENERVYSVRFDGDVAYFVTYRETDPLFAVDLSRPDSPAVMSALKIPGFSQYLHLYGDGLLFGLGMGESTQDTGIGSVLKLSMFDVSDPYNVTELSTLLLDSSYSEALYNHHAILVSPEKNLIGLCTDAGYELYRYNEDGFVRAAQFDIDELYSVRSLYIGDWLYIISPRSISIVSMDSWWVADHIALD